MTFSIIGIIALVVIGYLVFRPKRSLTGDRNQRAFEKAEHISFFDRNSGPYDGFLGPLI